MNVRLVHSASPSPSYEVSSLQKERMVATLRGLLRDTCLLRNQGAPYAKLAHAQGYADGFMRVMVDGGFIDNHELLEIIRDVRHGVDGPATKTLAPETLATPA